MADQIILLQSGFLSATEDGALNVNAEIELGDLTVDVDTAALEAGIGAPNDAAATQGGTGSLTAKARLMTSQLNTLAGYLDGVETLLTAVDGHVDGIEGLLTTIDGHVDGLEGFTDGIETLLTAIDGHVDGLEGVAGTTSGAAVITDANGTQQQYLRGLVTLWLAGLKAGEAHIGEVGGKISNVTGTFARPSDTTPYGANDVVSNSDSASTPVTLTSVARVSGGSGYIVGARLITDKKSITPRFRVHLFSASDPTLANDNVNFKALYSEYSKRIASFDLAAMSTPADATNSDLSGVSDFTLRIPFVTVGSANMYYALETLDAFTPASAQNFRLVIFVDNN